MTILKMTYFYMSFLRILFYIFTDFVLYFYGFCFTIYSKKDNALHVFKKKRQRRLQAQLQKPSQSDETCTAAS